MFNLRHQPPIDFEKLGKISCTIVGTLQQMKNLWPQLEKKYENLISGHVLDLLREISQNDPENIQALQRRIVACRLDTQTLEGIESMVKMDQRVLSDLRKNSSLYFLAIDESLAKMDTLRKERLNAQEAFGEFFKLGFEDRKFYIIILCYIRENANRFCELLEETHCKQTEGQEKCRDITLSKPQGDPDVELDLCIKAFSRLLPSENEFAELREWAEDPIVTADPTTPSFDIEQTVSQLRRANKLMRDCKNAYQEFCEILEKIG
jgi:hypothetical protein